MTQAGDKYCTIVSLIKLVRLIEMCLTKTQVKICHIFYSE
jgi:hypothetical protein